MRAFHRILAIIACVFMLYVAATGTLIQSIDLKTILSGTPESDPVMQSINEGKFGNADYAVVSNVDWDGAALPKDIDTAKAFATVLAAYHKIAPDHGPEFAELRVADGRVIGQLGYADPAKRVKPGTRGTPIEVKAFDAATGEAVAPINIAGAKPVSSPRQTLKEWHRFWGPTVFLWRGDKPGVYIEFAVGLVFCTLIFTGLIMYFRLLRARRKIGKPQMFWMAGEKWRSLHRVVSVAAAILLTLVALSGTWLGFESSWHTFAARDRVIKPGPLSDVQVQRLAEATMASFRKAEPQTQLRVIRVRTYAGMEQGGVVTDGPFTRQLVFDVNSGRELNLSEPQFPSGGFPLGTDVHEWVKHFHSGYLFGLPARFMSLLAGLSLLFLSISGIVMYFQMWNQRRSTGRGGFFWKR